MELGFIGIGRMGSRMAPRLLAAGYALSIHDMNRSACEPLVERGANWCATPADVAKRSDIVLTSVPGPAEVEAIMNGPGGIISAARPGSLVIETSTISPAQSRELARRCAEGGFAYVDAPVSNGVGPAEKGELTIMVGGDKADYDKAVPVLRHLGTRIYHMGPIGSGNIAKLINQIIYLAYVATFCETARLARQAGLDVPNLVDVLRNSVAGDPMMTGWVERIESGDMVPGFQIRRVLKDLGLGAQVCGEHKFDAPVLESVVRAFRDAGEAGFMEMDMTAIYTGR